MRAAIIVIAAGLALTACREERAAAPPAPVAMTAEALGHYCQMNLTEHPGPKAQVHLEGLPAPLFFSQVRDAIAYERMPEQSHAIRAIYVTDMAAAPSWQSPGIDNWVAAQKALYVVGSKVAGGMGAQELVPFSDRAAAQAFVGKNGGEIRSLTEIPDEQVLAPVEFKTDAQGNFLPPQAASDH
jgi:copper chaperone NosL